MEAGISISFLIAFAGGLISFMSPCVLPLIPSYLSVVSGVSYEQMTAAGPRDGRLRRKVLISSLLFVTGFSLVFILLGASINVLTESLMGFRQQLTFVGGLLIIFFGLFIAGVLNVGFLKKYFKPLEGKNGPRAVGYVGALLVGISFGIGWTPCVGPTLGAILTLAAVES
ncbi:MAG: cytochrome c biogenesis CcdA family protein, partial [Nitrospinota bacterium]